MNRNILELANELCRAVQKKRLDRIGVEPLSESPGQSWALDQMPREDRQSWLDVAQSILEFQERDGEGPSELRRLADDWALYGEMLKADPEHRDSMRRAIVVELRVRVEKMWKECGGE